MPLRVATFQSTPNQTFPARKRQVLAALEDASKKQIDFLCFPEGFLTGYYPNREEAYANSFDVESQDFQEFLFELRPFQTTVIIGFNERVGEHLYNSAAVIEGRKLLGVQRKHYLYHDYFSQGESFSPVKSKGLSFGVMICLDANHFEPARLLSLKGASLIFCPMCNKVPVDHPLSERPLYYSHFAARSFENRCWLITADWQWPTDGTSICPGHTTIYDPDGREVIRSKAFKEEMVCFDIPKETLAIKKGRRVHGSGVLNKELEKVTSNPTE